MTSFGLILLTFCQATVWVYGINGLALISVKRHLPQGAPGWEPAGTSEWRKIKRENLLAETKRESLFPDTQVLHRNGKSSNLSALLFRSDGREIKCADGFFLRENLCCACDWCSSVHLVVWNCSTKRNAACVKAVPQSTECRELLQKAQEQSSFDRLWQLLTTYMKDIISCFPELLPTMLEIGGHEVTKENVIRKRDNRRWPNKAKRPVIQNSTVPMVFATNGYNGVEDEMAVAGGMEEAGFVPRGHFASDKDKSMITSFNDPVPGLEHAEGSSDSGSGTASWVYITIGVAVVLLCISTFVLTLLYRKRQSIERSRNINKPPPTGAVNPSLYDTTNSRSTDRGTEKSKSTVSTILSGDSFDVRGDCCEVELYEMSEQARRERYVKSDVAVTACDELCSLSAPPRVKVINTSRTLPEPNVSSGSLLRSCITADGADSDTDSGVTSKRSFFSMLRDDENKLRGGNGDFHRKYVDVDYVLTEDRLRNRPGRGKETQYRKHCPTSISHSSTSSRHRSRNESNASSSASHHSARSIISIPPTSPSENYVEAASDDSSLWSQRSSPPTTTTTEWLTKSIKTSPKNELGSYQSSIETQTEDSVSSPGCKTVFGSSWQFGGSFTSRGGVMQANGSDVSLVVVANAIPKSRYVDIYGAVFTDVSEIRRKFELPSGESLISPVVEYHAAMSEAFNRFVCVQLPHSLPDEFDINAVKVYTFSVGERGRVSVHCLKHKSKSNEFRDDAYWEKGVDGTVDISTTHFSGYFCTTCETSSLPSICAMVFGSHVQITKTRREVRVFLYIWDRKLTIKDYLERFMKQESEVDRQLLTDMQIPLLDDASSNSRLLMRMQQMGEENDRLCWRHVMRPDGSRPLFKPLQVRKLNEIVHCCRQTDPIRVEWALENVPNQVPSSVFQCCFDIMHVHESTRDYETALHEDSDDLMRTFYVRYLEVSPVAGQVTTHEAPNVRRGDLKRTLSQLMDVGQTEQMCKEFGIPGKDLGNFRKKYSSEEKIQMGLVDECLKRYGHDTFIRQLPAVLQKLQLFHVLSQLESNKIVVDDLAKFEGIPKVNNEDPRANNTQAKVSNMQHNAVPKSGVENVRPKSLVSVDEDTRPKSLYHETSSEAERHHRNRSKSPASQRPRSTRGRSVSPHRRGSRQENPNGYNSRQNSCERRLSRERVSQRSDEVFVQSEMHPQSYSKHRRNSLPSGRKRDSPPPDYHDEEEDFHLRQHPYSDHGASEEEQPLNPKKSSSSGSDSFLRGGSITSPDYVSQPLSFPSRSTEGYSVIAQAGSREWDNVSDDDEFSQTYKKELAVQQEMRTPYYPQAAQSAYPEVTEELLPSSSGPSAFPDGGHARRERSSSRNKSRNRSVSPGHEQTSKKELYGVQTVV
ncbi:uncharacterized protein LOC101859152 isoform X2 [Aplysia californica]|uniref:Uncharacterized protein LOC101859152 isoform X2 n=1 Tax=Aplysia californica TaxID=6500 RepID=A0ABM0ZU96_APLCA|nr:uncharacterized protein LOC101859152 isoform X2 [Aplysia californica]